jgi:hypothetical protein
VLAILAVIAFAIALILHLVGGGADRFVTDFTLAGLILVALHLALAGGFSWPRRTA